MLIHKKQIYILNKNKFNHLFGIHLQCCPYSQASFETSRCKFSKHLFFFSTVHKQIEIIIFQNIVHHVVMTTYLLEEENRSEMTM